MMAGPNILSFHDAYTHLFDFVGKDGSSPAQRDIVRAIQQAHTELANAHAWEYYESEYRIRLSAPYSTGTITYDHTGGTYEREVTLASGTWPSWAASGKLRIGATNHNVATRESDTVITLDPSLNPGTDVAAGTSYTLFRSEYPLPQDMISMSSPLNEDNWWYNSYVTPNAFLRLEKHGYTTGSTYAWTIKGDPNNLSQLVIAVYPAADAGDSMDFMYRRRPRRLLISGAKTAHTQGTIATTSGSTTVTGTGTSFDSSMVGSLFRRGDATNTPDGIYGLNPYQEERSIIAVASTTSLTLDAGSSATSSGVKYMVTDPVDIEHSMANLFLRCCEKQIAQGRRMEDVAQIVALYDMELRKAKNSSSRSTQSRFAGDGMMSGHRRLADFPLGADIE
jgi:hypothetical protein